MAKPTTSGGSERVMPDVSDMTPLRAALAYARAGIYVLPVQPGTKNPGSVVGGDWPAMSSRDTGVIRDWWRANPRYGIALHAGRSGLVVFDIDNVALVPKDWYGFLGKAPCNTTRREDPVKGHYFFLQPADKVLGNGKAGLKEKAWGDIRGSNGVVIAPPSQHPDKVNGLYRQRRTGVIGPLPQFIVAQLHHAEPGQYALDDMQMRRFLKEHSGSRKPRMITGVRKLYAARMQAGESRHTTAVECLCWGFREARAGYYPAEEVEKAVREMFLSSLNDEGNERFPGEGEWRDIVRWAAAQAYANTPEEIRDLVEGRDAKRQEERTADGLYRPQLGTGTDQEHAKEVLKWISDRAVYSFNTDTWLLKRDGIWVVSPKFDGRNAVALVAEEMPMGEEPGENVEKHDLTEANFEWELRQRYQSSQKSAGISQKINALVASQEAFSINMQEVDSDFSVLWCKHGPRDLFGEEGKQLRGTEDEGKSFARIDRNAVHQKCTRYPALERETPYWDEFLRATLPDPEVRAWFLQLAAVGFTGLSPRMFIYLYGETGRGKTSLPLLLCDVLGNYARADLNSAMLSKDAKPWDLVALHGLRLGFIDEMPSGAGGPTEVLKRITGGTEINAAHKNKPPFSFMPMHTLIFASNTVPDLHDPAVEERLRAIPCVGDPQEIRIARAKIGEMSGKIWQQEAPGVLWQMIELARKYIRDPQIILNEHAPAVIRRKTSELRKEQNVLEQWLDDNTAVIKPSGSKTDWSTPTQIYDLFLRWCKSNHRGRRYLNDNYTVDTLGRELSRMARRKGYITGRSEGKRKWNIDLNPAHVKARG